MTELLAPSGSTLKNYMLSEVKLNLLQRSSTELPLDGREIEENTLINMKTSTLIPVKGYTLGYPGIRYK